MRVCTYNRIQSYIRGRVRWDCSGIVVLRFVALFFVAAGERGRESEGESEREWDKERERERNEVAILAQVLANLFGGAIPSRQAQGEELS